MNRQNATPAQKLVKFSIRAEASRGRAKPHVGSPSSPDSLSDDEKSPTQEPATHRRAVRASRVD